MRVFSRSLGIEIDQLEISDAACFLRYFNPNIHPREWKVRIFHSMCKF